MNRLLTVWPAPSNLAPKGEEREPIGSQPYPPFQYASPASAAPLPFVSKSRSKANS